MRLAPLFRAKHAIRAGEALFAVVVHAAHTARAVLLRVRTEQDCVHIAPPAPVAWLERQAPQGDVRPVPRAVRTNRAPPAQLGAAVRRVQKLVEAIRATCARADL